MTEEAPAPVSAEGWRLMLTHVSESADERLVMMIRTDAEAKALDCAAHGLTGAKARFVARLILASSAEMQMVQDDLLF